MRISVQQLGDWHAVVAPDGPVRTPMGTPLVSRYRELAEEVAADVARHGTDPTARTSFLSFQASYLDFGLRVRREVLEENTAAIWPDDLYVQRPPQGEAERVLRELWPPVEVDRVAFREALRTATLRQVMAAMTAGQVLRSAVLGWVVVTTSRDLVPLTLGACGRHFAARSGGEAGGRVRHVPTEWDDAYCAEVCCAASAGPDARFGARCALHPLLDKLRRWAAFPEETPDRQGALE